MESFATQRFVESKIDGFDSCMMDASAQQQDIAQTVTEDVSVQDENVIESEENHDTSSIQQVQTQHNQISPVLQQNSQNNVTLTPVRLPAILDGEFFTVIRLEDTNVTARCLQCNKLLNGNLKSTGNFLSHIKRVHPFLLERIKSKSNQRKPAAIYVDLSQDRTQEYLRIKNRFKKSKMEEVPSEESYDHTEWIESPGFRKRKSEDYDPNDMLRVSQNNSIIVENDEFDAIGRNVAAKLRQMRLDQRIIAEKLLNDILFEAQLGNLHRNCSINV